MKPSKLTKQLVNKVANKIAKKSTKEKHGVDFCLRYNTPPSQLYVFKKACKVLLLKSPNLVEKVEENDWVHISIVSENNKIKVFYDGMFDSVVLESSEFIDSGEPAYFKVKDFEIKGYVAIDGTIEIIE